MGRIFKKMNYYSYVFLLSFEIKMSFVLQKVFTMSIDHIIISPEF